MRISIQTFGCAVNQADSEIIAGLLEEEGYEISTSPDVFVINTCTVKAPTESKILKRLRELKSEKVVVAGCLPPVRKELVDQFPHFSFIGTNIGDISDAISSCAKGNQFVKIDNSKDKTCKPRVRKNPIVEIVQISQGCAGECSYCETKRARGNLKSYSQDKLIRQIQGAVSDGIKELWITAQDTGAYGADTGYSLPELLREIIEIPGQFNVRVGMMNPNHAIAFIDELYDVYKSDKVYNFLHLPVQSGDDNVLKDMGRQYKVEEFEHVVAKFRKANTTISTDVIVGYPTETEEAFENTLKLIKKTKPDIVNLSRFWPRPKTRASKLKEIDGAQTKSRSRQLNQLFKRIGGERNKRWIGFKGSALVSEKNKDGTFTARNYAYKPVIVASNEAILGATVNVKVTESTYYDLRGIIL